MAILLALAASLGWGSADYLGGQQTRRHALIPVIVVSQAFGVAGCLLVVAVHGVPVPHLMRLVPAMLGGAAGTVSIVCFYKALAIGTMSIAAPITATGAAVPVIVGMATGERPAALQLAGMAIAFGGALLVAHEPQPAEGEPASPKSADARLSVILAFVAALGIGLLLTGLHASSRADPYWALLAARGTSVSCFAVLLIVTRPRLGLRPADVPLLAVLGIVDTGANGLFAVASTLGYLSIVAVLGSLYPITTVVLAHILLGERVARGQAIGIVAALAGVALIAAG